MDGDDVELDLRPSSSLTRSLNDSRRELGQIERDVAAGVIELDTALALAFVSGVEHARRLLLA